MDPSTFVGCTFVARQIIWHRHESARDCLSCDLLSVTKVFNSDKSSKSTEEADSCGKRNTCEVWVHSQRPHTSFPQPPMHLPLFGSHHHLSAVEASIHSVEMFFIKTSKLIWHNCQEACLGNGNIELNIVRNTESVLQWMDVCCQMSKRGHQRCHCIFLLCVVVWTPVGVLNGNKAPK